jgi:hypothetical protein
MIRTAEIHLVGPFDYPLMQGFLLYKNLYSGGRAGLDQIQKLYNDEMNDTGKSLTRRKWAIVLSIAPIVAPVLSAQVATTPNTPPPVSAPPPGVPAERLAKAVSAVRKVSDRLAQTEVPIGIEPAFSFHV